MNIQKMFTKHLILNKNLLACYEVSHYAHRCDVLAVDRNKPIIYEYEFKSSSNDLKIAEFKKDKYKPYKCTYGNDIAKSYHWKYSVYKKWKEPHYFYFVMPEELFNREKNYLKSLSVGTIYYKENKTGYGHVGNMDFYVGKRTHENKSNTQSYFNAMKNITERLTNLYVFESQGESDD